MGEHSGLETHRTGNGTGGSAPSSSAITTVKELALVTGASSGIGAAVARALAKRGIDVVLTARRAKRLQELKTEIESVGSVRAHVIALDLADPAGPRRLCTELERQGHNVSILVNNAGFGVYGRLWQNDPARLTQMLQLNMVSLTELTSLIVAGMVKRGRGYVLQVASIAAYQPSPFYAAYAATKAYVLFLSQALDWELRGTGVSVTTVCPGMTSTEFHAVADHIKPKSMDRLAMTAEEVAEIGVRAMFRRKTVVTTGLLNKISALMVKLSPRSLATAAAARIMRSDKVALPP